MKRIIVKIDLAGTAKVEADGFNGQGCAAATEGIERALTGGSGEVVRDFKPEWQYDSAEQDEQQHQSW